MERQLKPVLWIAILASFVAFLDGSVVNVALPAIQHDFGGGLTSQQWVVDAYLISLGSLILIAGSLSDLFGRKRIMKLGLWGFGVASIICAVAPNVMVLILARLFQGAAGALLVPSSLALITSSFRGKSQAKAIGSWTAYTSVAFVAGPLLGGFLVDFASWRLVFAINILPIVLTLYLLTKLTNKDREVKGAKVDMIGAILCAVMLGGPVFGLIELTKFGPTSPVTLLPLLGGLIAGAMFIVYEKRTFMPMLPLSIFRHHNFSVGNIATFAIYAGLTAMTFLVTVFIQQVGGYSAFMAGMALLPVTIIMLAFSRWFGSLSGSHGPRLFMGVGPLIMAVGMFMLLGLNAHSSYFGSLLPAVIVFGLGLAITVAPLTAAILGDVEPTRAGIASAINNAVARTAGLLAVAVIGVIISVQFSSSMTSEVGANPSKATSTALAQTKKNPLIIALPKAVSADRTYYDHIVKSSYFAFRSGVWMIIILEIIGGIISLLGIRNPIKSDHAH